MSLFNVLRTSVSGMNAQSMKLGAVSENIANANTTGYKMVSAQFSSMVDQVGRDSFVSGGVVTHLRYGVSEQGGLTRTSSSTDLAIQGRGFFVVSDSAGRKLLTRAGSFVPDASGTLRNAAGYALMGVPVNASGGAVNNDVNSLQVVTVDRAGLVAEPTKTARLSANLPPDAATVAAANLPSANAAGAAYSSKTSMIVYDNIGRQVTLDIYTAKTGPNAWEVSVFNAADAASGGGFPYASAPLATTSLAFDPANGQLATGSPTSLSLAIPGGQTATLDLAGSSQLAGPYQVLTMSVDGQAPSQLDHVEVDEAGQLVSVYKNGARKPTYTIPLADVTSPDRLTVVEGNAFDINSGSGPLIVANANSSGMGAIYSGALESSTVDLANELTSMIETQRAYSANSKAFQTGADMLDVLLNLRA